MHRAEGPSTANTTADGRPPPAFDRAKERHARTTGGDEGATKKTSCTAKASESWRGDVTPSRPRCPPAWTHRRSVMEGLLDSSIARWCASRSLKRTSTQHQSNRGSHHVQCKHVRAVARDELPCGGSSSTTPKSARCAHLYATLGQGQSALYEP